MPPVLGPCSPSTTRLWSCAAASGSACSPSTRAKKLASSPTRNSSMTTSAPAAPNAPAKQASMAAVAASRVSAMTTPLPAARPSALTTIGSGCVGQIGLGGARVREAAVGGGGNARTRAEVLGEALRALELGGRLGRAEHLDPGGGQIVGEAGHQRRLGAHHHEADVVVAAEADDGGMVGRRRASRISATSAMPALPGAQ